MARNFDTDPIGALLEYAVLAQRYDGRAHHERAEWLKENVRHPMVELLQPWGGPPGTVTKTSLINVLQSGRDAGEVRQKVTWAFGVLEANHFLLAWRGDANTATTYREVSELGRELLETDSYQEFLYGSTRIVERWRHSVVRLVNPDGDGIGTGFFVSPTTIATAAHVTEDLPGFAVETETGQRFEYADVIRHARQTIDLALVCLKEPVRIRSFQIATTCELLDPVVVFGYPPIPRTNDAYLVVNRGEISSKPILYHDEQQIIIVSCLLRGGYSGGPVVNNRGQVVGIVSQQLFRQVAPDEKSINESLGLAAATEAYHLKGIA